jgi:hypothetical protein
VHKNISTFIFKNEKFYASLENKLFKIFLDVKGNVGG